MVFPRTGLERLPAFVGHLGGGFQQHQTLLHVHAVETPAREVVDKRLIIVFGIVAAQREFEAVFPFGRPVAGAGIATELAENGLDVTCEMDFRDYGILDGDGNLRLERPDGNRYLRFALRFGSDVAGLVYFDVG